MNRVSILSLLAAFVVALLLAVGQPAGGGQAEPEGDHEAVTSNACGVERWAVKTGTDTGGRRINLNVVTSANIFHLRSLPAPGDLPGYSRIPPVEDTVYRVQARIARVKIEADSDYHLVLEDAGGRTMIGEIPDPRCVGSSSPFLPRIRAVRSTFDRRYTVTEQWQRINAPVTITGVGFFDFKHGQSGVAPNAIELHPVLGIAFGGGSPAPTSRSRGKPRPKPTLTPPSGPPTGRFSLRAWVSPNPVSYGSYATLSAQTSPRASCTANVRYSTGYPPRSFDGSARTAGSDGMVSWSWHMESKGSSGTGTVSCSLRGQTKTATTTFEIG